MSDKALQPSPRAVAQALDSLQEAAGGRQALVSQLLHAPETPEQKYVLGLLADPRSDALNLSRVCEQGQVSLGQLIHLLKEAKASKALLESMDRIAKYLPEVAEDLMARARPHDLPCWDCEGRGEVKVPVLDEKGKATGDWETKPCEPCRGRGQIRTLPSLDRQKVALEVGGLLKRQSGVTVNVSQQAATFNFSGDARRDFRSATDALLYRRQDAGASGAGARGDVVDAEPADQEPEGGAVE